MDFIDYKIVIPTYKRPLTVAQKTLSYLQDCKIDFKNVYLFVASEEEFKEYEYCKDLYGVNIVVGVPRLMAQRNFIKEYFPEGTPLVHMDDDIEGIYIKIDDKKYQLFHDLPTLFQQAFTECKKQETPLWGIGAVLNALFMKNKISTDLRLIVGCFWGWFNCKDITLTIDEKEDYERSILVYEKYGKVVRFNNFAPKTKFYKEGGGMQDYRTIEHSFEAAAYLMEKYPKYVKINNNRKGERAEVRLYHNPKKDPFTDQPTLF